VPCREPDSRRRRRDRRADRSPAVIRSAAVVSVAPADAGLLSTMPQAITMREHRQRRRQPHRAQSERADRIGADRLARANRHGVRRSACRSEGRGVVSASALPGGSSSLVRSLLCADQGHAAQPLPSASGGTTAAASNRPSGWRTNREMTGAACDRHSRDRAVELRVREPLAEIVPARTPAPLRCRVDATDAVARRRSWRPRRSAGEARDDRLERLEVGRQIASERQPVPCRPRARSSRTDASSASRL
jgi:hypothetical protein